MDFLDFLWISQDICETFFPNYTGFFFRIACPVFLGPEFFGKVYGLGPLDVIKLNLSPINGPVRSARAVLATHHKRRSPGYEPVEKVVA